MSAENERNIVLLYESKIIYEKFCRVFGTRYEIHWGKDLNSTMEILESRTIGVLVCDVHFHQQDIYPVVLALKSMHPELVTMIVTQSQDAQLVSELAAQEEIFAALVRPVSQQRLNDTLDDAFQYYLNHRKHIVEELLAKEAEEEQNIGPSIFGGMSLGEILAARAQQHESHSSASFNDALPDDIFALEALEDEAETVTPVAATPNAEETAATFSDVTQWLDEFDASQITVAPKGESAKIAHASSAHVQATIEPINKAEESVNERQLGQGKKERQEMMFFEDIEYDE